MAKHCVGPWWSGGALEIDLDDHSQRLTLDIVTSLAFNKAGRCRLTLSNPR